MFNLNLFCIIFRMDNVQKFLADVARIKKHEYAEHSSSYSGERVCADIKSLFVKNNAHVRSLAESYTDYWMSEYILPSAEMQNEPTQEHLDKIAAMQSLIDNDVEMTDALSEKDWSELCELTGYEAEDMDVDLLNDLMSIFLDKGAV